MNKTIKRMNDVLNDWKKTFEFMNIEQEMCFFVNEKGELCFNDIPLRHMSDLILESSNFDTDKIVFRFNNGRKLTLGINWPEDAAPYVDSILLKYSVSELNINNYFMQK